MSICFLIIYINKRNKEAVRLFLLKLKGRRKFSLLHSFSSEIKLMMEGNEMRGCELLLAFLSASQV